LSFLAEAQPRLENRRGQKALFVGFIANLLNRPTASEKMRPKKCVRKNASEKVRPKKSYFSSASVFVKGASKYLKGGFSWMLCLLHLGDDVAD
jgi:hypothetical protein